MFFLYPYREEIHTLKKDNLAIFPLDYSDKIAVSYLSNKYFSVGAQRFKEMIKEIGRGIAFFAV